MYNTRKYLSFSFLLKKMFIYASHFNVTKKSEIDIVYSVQISNIE